MSFVRIPHGTDEGHLYTQQRACLSGAVCCVKSRILYNLGQSQKDTATTMEGSQGWGRGGTTEGQPEGWPG